MLEPACRCHPDTLRCFEQLHSSSSRRQLIHMCFCIVKHSNHANPTALVSVQGGHPCGAVHSWQPAHHLRSRHQCLCRACTLALVAACGPRSCSGPGSILRGIAAGRRRRPALAALRGVGGEVGAVYDALLARRLRGASLHHHARCRCIGFVALEEQLLPNAVPVVCLCVGKLNGVRCVLAGRASILT